MNRRVFSGSRANRSRREQSYARAVIAQAQRIRLKTEDKDCCLFCSRELADRDHYPYCSQECGMAAEREGA